MLTITTDHAAVKRSITVHVLPDGGLGIEIQDPADASVDLEIGPADRRALAAYLAEPAR